MEPLLPPAAHLDAEVVEHDPFERLLLNPHRKTQPPAMAVKLEIMTPRTVPGGRSSSRGLPGSGSRLRG